MVHAFWQDEISKSECRRGIGTDTNCASQSTSGAVDPNALDLTVVTPRFYEVRDGAPKIVSFFAKSQEHGAVHHREPCDNVDGSRISIWRV